MRRVAPQKKFCPVRRPQPTFPDTDFSRLTRIPVFLTVSLHCTGMSGGRHKRPAAGRGTGRGHGGGITIGSGPTSVGEPLGVVVAADAAFAAPAFWAACPWTLQTRVPNSAGITVQALYTVSAWDVAAVSSLLSWFAAGFGREQQPCAASVTFPAWLPKDDRARVHAAAEQLRCGLVALSDGLGEQRHVSIHSRRSADLLAQQRRTAECVADDAAAAVRERQLDDLAALARKTPGREALSRGELKLMLRQDAVPPDLAGTCPSRSPGMVAHAAH